jgi:REP element-mobilizing transposase RayT
MEKRLKDLFYEIAGEQDSEIFEMKLMPDHVYLPVSAAPR